LVTRGDRVPDFFPSVVELESGAHVFHERFPGGWSLSRIASYFAASHAMSMLVRYHPTRWARLVNHAPGDKLMPVLDRLRHLIQNDFARLGLREFERSEPAASAAGGARDRTKFKPDGWHTVTPRIIVQDPANLVDFLRGVSPGSGWRKSARKREGKWLASTIYGDPRRGCGILNNEMYIARCIPEQKKAEIRRS